MRDVGRGGVSVTDTDLHAVRTIGSRNAVRRIRNYKGEVMLESRLANADAGACYVCGEDCQPAACIKEAGRVIRTVALEGARDRGTPLFTRILDTTDKQTRQKRGD